MVQYRKLNLQFKVFAHTGISATYATRLSLPGKNLQFLIISVDVKEPHKNSIDI